MDNQILISVITVVKNGAATIEKAIQSVASQKANYVEYIVLDGQSTDGTIEIIKKYENIIDYFVSEKDSGATNAAATAAKLAKGKYIAFLCCDDFYEGNIFEYVREAIYSTSADIISIPCKIIDQNGDNISLFNSPENLAVNISNALYQPIFCSKFFKKEVFEQNNYFCEHDDDGSSFISADLEFMLKCVLNKNTYALVNQNCYYVYLSHKGSTTFSGNKEIILKCYKEHIKIYERLFINFPNIKAEYKLKLKKWYYRALLKSAYYETRKLNIAYLLYVFMKFLGLNIRKNNV